MKLSYFVIFLFIIEFLDELVGGVINAAWPLIKQDLSLNYIQVGIALSLPSIVGNVIEPVLGILSETGKRRSIVITGAILFGLAVLLAAASRQFYALLISLIIFYPASGAFVSLSQAALMDFAPDEREVNMAKWVFSGSLGVVAGPLMLTAFLSLNGNWRHALIATGITSLAILPFIWEYPYQKPDHRNLTFRAGLKASLRSLSQKGIIRWLVALEFSDLMLDVLMAYLALYYVDVVGCSPAYAALAVAAWSGAGLLGDFLLIPLLRKVEGLVYLRLSVMVELALYPLFLLSPWLWAKLVLLGLLGLFNAGWYSILKAQLFSAMPDRSGLALTVSNISGLAGSCIPFAIGFAAQFFGLSVSMWLLLLGPIALLICVPTHRLK